MLSHVFIDTTTTTSNTLLLCKHSFIVVIVKQFVFKEMLYQLQLKVILYIIFCPLCTCMVS